MHIAISHHARSARAAFLTELALPLILLILSLAFTIPFFLLKTTHVISNDEPRCLANGDAIFPWNHTVNEYWDPSTALFITLGSGSYTYPEAKAIDVMFDLLVGRGGQVLVALMAFNVIRKSMLLSAEKQPIPLPLTFSVYFDGPLRLAWTILQNLLIPFRARQYREKAVSCWRLFGWMYLCVYILVMPTLMSAMTGYQTTAAVWFRPALGSGQLASAVSLSPNPPLTIRDGSRVGLPDNQVVSLNFTSTESQLFDERYDTILGYYFAIQNALYNATWHLTVSEMTEPNLQGAGPAYTNAAVWSYCTVSQYGNYCAPDTGDYGSPYAPPPADAPDFPTPDFTWSSITLVNTTHNLQPPPLDIVWAAPAATWSLALTNDRTLGGYFTNSSIAQSAVCQPDSRYQWGFSAMLLFLFCCMTIVFAATLLALDLSVWLHSRSDLYQQPRGRYSDAACVVQALREEFGDKVVEESPEEMDEKVKSHTGAIQVETETLPFSRRQSGLHARRRTGRSESSKEELQSDVPLLDIRESNRPPAIAKLLKIWAACKSRVRSLEVVFR